MYAHSIQGEVHSDTSWLCPFSTPTFCRGMMGYKVFDAQIKTPLGNTQEAHN